MLGVSPVAGFGASRRPGCLPPALARILHYHPSMQKYQIPKLTEKTSQADQTKIVTALRKVDGVASATLHPKSHEVELKVNEKREPKRTEIASAVSSIGFPLATK